MMNTSSHPNPSPQSSPLTLAVVGGGAAGFFGSIIAAQAAPHARVVLLEKSKQLLTKVRISGGGRCNVTHSCFEPKQLIQNYPRGGKALLGPFSRFQPADTIEWFLSRGVTLKTESDGRIFPVTDSSETIARCLQEAARNKGVEIQTCTGVQSITPLPNGFELTLSNNQQMHCHRLLLACGSNLKMWELLKGLGHTLIPPVPSLFTFNTPTSPLLELAGVSMAKVRAKIVNTSLEQTGPILLTHWGFSGPAILKLSAWGARILHDMAYQATLEINWLPEIPHEELKEQLLGFKSTSPARLVANEFPPFLPRNLWKKLIELAGIPATLRWSHLSTPFLQKIVQQLTSSTFQINGKSTYKDEFVTCGGVALNEVNFKTMQSKLIPHLYFAGEILDIDGVTGGFNFQNAWTTAYIAGKALWAEGP